MKRHFALPAAFALTLLAFLLLGFAKADVRLLSATKTIITEFPLSRPLPDTPPELQEWEREPSKAPSRPSQPERPDPVDLKKISETADYPRPLLSAIPSPGPVTIDRELLGISKVGGGSFPGSPGAIEASLLDNSPKAQSQLPPAYPPAARAAGINAEVIVEFVVDHAGRVLNPRIVRSNDHQFDEPTLRAVAKWRFEPGTKGSRPVSFRMVVPIMFRVDE